jgi:hypothetical protein
MKHRGASSVKPPIPQLGVDHYPIAAWRAAGTGLALAAAVR